MNSKYIIHGATYCGDGTASNEAASAGAAGAWNNINVFEGTAPAYGTAPAAGDVVYIRSKTGNGADANITRTMTGNVSLGSASATANSPIHWILDNGTIWSGVDGTLTYTHATTYVVTILANNRIEAKTLNKLVIVNTATNPSGSIASVAGHLIGAKFDTTAKTGANNHFIYTDSGCLENCTFDLGRLSGSTTASFIYRGANPNSVTLLINPIFRLNYSTPGGQALMGGAGSFLLDLTVIGGEVTAGLPGATTGQLVVYQTVSGNRVRLYGFNVPKALTMSADMTVANVDVEAIGCDGGIGGHYEALWGYATSRTDNNPPTLSARFADSGATPWAYRVYPRNVSLQMPMRLPMMKLFTDTAAAKVITQEILVADTLTATKANIWMSVQYIDDTTGLPKWITTLAPSGNLDSSSAGWTTTAWGLVKFVKRKLSVTTPTTIKQNTPILVTLFGILKSATANDILFIDPDFSLTTP